MIGGKNRDNAPVAESIPLSRTIAFTDPYKMDQGLNQMMDAGYFLHSWHLDPYSDARRVEYGRFICVFMLAQQPPASKSDGLAAR